MQPGAGRRYVRRTWHPGTGAGDAPRPGRGGVVPRGLTQRPQDVLHDAAVAVVVGFAGGVDPDRRGEALAVGSHHDFVRNTPVVELGDALDAEGLLAGEAEGLGALARLELQREHAHADQVGAVDALERLDEHGTDAEQRGALRGPVAGGAGAVLLAAEDDLRGALGNVLAGGVVDRHLLAVLD